MGAAKQVMYRYNGDDANNEVEVDRDGEIPHYKDGEIIQRKGKPWKVGRVLVQHTGDNIPVHIVDLTDKF